MTDLLKMTGCALAAGMLMTLIDKRRRAWRLWLLEVFSYAGFGLCLLGVVTPERPLPWPPDTRELVWFLAAMLCLSPAAYLSMKARRR